VEAARAAERRKPFALLPVKLLELDHINRELGYAAGDAVIQHVARVVEQMGDRCGGTAARLGGVFIALLVPGVSDELVQRLSAELECDLAGNRVRVVTSVWREGESGEDVIDRALGRLTATVRA
jgi:GGDEF domain-containing protein